MSDDTPLRFDEKTVQSRSGERTALIVTPTAKIVLGRDRLARLREGDRSSAVDDRVIEELKARGKPYDALLMCSWDGPEASWGFDESLDQDELLALGYHLMRGHLKLFRRAIVLGTTAVCSTDLTPRDFDAVLEGWRRLGRELRDKDELDRNLKEETDLFLLDHFTLWTTRPLQEFVDQALPAVFDLVHKHREQFGRLKERLVARDKKMHLAD